MASVPCYSRVRGIVLVLLVASFPSVALAHWCDDLWASAYNIVVRPQSDTLDVPATGSATVDVWVQNNMGYALPNFELTADATGFAITLASAPSYRPGFLLPGEKLLHVMTVSRAGATPTLDVANVVFYVAFGDPGQDAAYGNNGTGVMVRKADGSLAPARPVANLDQSGMQSASLGASARADYGDATQAVSNLMAMFCAGRGSWVQADGTPISASGTPTYCANATTTVCPSRVTRAHTKYDWAHLWDAHELAYRKSILTTTQLSTLRARLMCSWNDAEPGFEAFSLFVLGYLGDDATARTFLNARVSSGIALDASLAKAALMMMGTAPSAPDLAAGLGSSDPFVAMTWAGARGVANGDDAAVRDVLLPLIAWIEPDTTDRGQAMTAAHIANLVAWHRRGWAADAGGPDAAVTFYGTGTDSVAPRAPTGVTCDVIAGTTLRVAWSPVTQDINNGAETVAYYRVASGPAADNYVHDDSTGGMSFDATGVEPGVTQHFAVRAVDTQGNTSTYSTDVACTLPVPARAPVASMSCNATSGTVPWSVSCQSTSADADGDIAHTYFRLDGGAYAEQTTYATTFAAAGNHVLGLRVVDATGLESSVVQALAAQPTAGGNAAPVAVASANLISGSAQVQISFSSTGSYDPEDGALGFVWDFNDGGAVSHDANPSHAFAAVGEYNVSLQVTDPEGLVGYDVVAVSIDGEASAPRSSRAVVTSVAPFSCAAAGGTSTIGLAVTIALASCVRRRRRCPQDRRVATPVCLEGQS
ncbi:MAG: PKD domain-containing protein [Myxococcota bacterium]